MNDFDYLSGLIFMAVINIIMFSIYFCGLLLKDYGTTLLRKYYGSQLMNKFKYGLSAFLACCLFWLWVYKVGAILEVTAALLGAFIVLGICEWHCLLSNNKKGGKR